MIAPLLAIGLLGMGGVSVVLWRQRQRLRREAFIRDYVLPQGLFERLRAKRPQLSLKDCQLASHALRHFFLAYLKGGRRYVSMPSQAADDLWHEFILFTRNYDAFCRRAFGGFLHHTPAVAVGGGERSDDGLQRVWEQACREDHINPRSPTRLPLLFALDAKLGLADGFHYVLDCASARVERVGSDGRTHPVIHCGADLAALSRRPRAGGDSSSGSSSGCSGGGSGDVDGGGGGGGDGGGGDGCGGGGCGGGD